MALSVKFLRKELKLLRPILNSCKLDSTRKGQEMVGNLLAATCRKDVQLQKHNFSDFEGMWVTPKTTVRNGVILYLHGGGYTCGGLDYAKGFGSVLAAKCGIKVFCAAYRLAPETPFPGAVEDALTAYTYLLKEGYRSEEIVLCGESAGGGLCYALPQMLKEKNMGMPCGIIGISPWTDLTMSGNSFFFNKEKDPTMTRELLDFFASCYTQDRENPLASPLFADLHGMPSSLLFVGGDEIMLDDARLMHKKLLSSGCDSELQITPGMWHGYVLYCLKKNKADFDRINSFLDRVFPQERKLRWMRLDNAAKIYPAAKRRNWSNVFRLSASLKEKVDPDILQSALNVTARRFPSISVRVRRGVFWYYLEEIPQAPAIQKDKDHPLVRMPFDDIRKCAFRVLYYENRIAVEFFHATTDGNGGLVFLKTLVAEYLTQKYGAIIPSTHGILDREDEPREEELEDSFLKNDGPVSASRSEATAYRLTGTLEPDGFLHNVCCMLPVKKVLEISKSYGVTLTEFLASVMMMAILQIQNEKIPKRKRQKPVKVLIPVNLRKLFDSETLRNFVLFITPGIDPRLGDYTFEEICRQVHFRMGYELTPQSMMAKITANVRSEKSIAVKILPLFLKNIAMKAVYNAVGECKACLSLSNLGAVQLPKEMECYIDRIDFVLGVQATCPSNCGVISFGDTLYVNFIRNIKEPELEAQFCKVLQALGLTPKVESNQR